MAFQALHQGKPVRPFDLDIDAKPFELCCMECSEEMHLVKEHPRQGSKDVSRHFRHNRDSCGFGGGESDIHKKRKADALSQALNKMDELGYDVATYGIEGADAYPTEYIGEKRPDSYLTFEDTHWRYGDGFAIEYQHENEDKDREEVTENYADKLYTTIWLWRDQFDSGEVDLFGGEVVVPWPKHVPSPGSWPDTFQERFADRWEKAAMSGLVTAGASATLPKEWHDDMALELWREQNWDDLFSDYAWWMFEKSTICLFGSEWEIADRSETPTHPNATFHLNKWLKDDCQFYRAWLWNDKGYKRVGIDDIDDRSQYDGGLMPQFLFEGIPTPHREELDRELMDSKLKSTDYPPIQHVVRKCPHCDQEETHDPIAKGEILRGTTCGNCHEWYTVEDRRGT